MNKILLVFILSSMLAVNLLSQNIYSALHHDRKADLRNNTNVTKIMSTNLFYNKSGIEKKKEISILNSSQQIISQTRFDENGEMNARLTFFFDSTGTKSLKRNFERWQPNVGHTFEIAYYEYDSLNNLIKVIDKNEKDFVIRETLLKNNSNGHPVECLVVVNGTIPNGREVAEYNYEQNLVVTKVIDESGKVLSENMGQIDYSKKSYKNYEYNELGDLVKSDTYTYEYTYDDNDNWTKQTIFKIVDGKRKKDRVFKRKIKYTK